MFKKIGLLYHPLNKPAYKLSGELQAYLEGKSVETWACSAWEWKEAVGLCEDTDLILCVGGDGTILRAAQVAVSTGIPITGINMGKLGFLTELKASEACTGLDSILGGKGWQDERSILELELCSETAPLKFYALNDIVAARGAISRVVYIETAIDDQPFTTYRADGVVVSTATGCTGYALSAGGPILNPRSKDFVLVPLLPHLSLSYTMIISCTSVVRLRITTVHEATLSIDGHINLPLASGAVLTVRRSTNTIRFLRVHPEGFYSTLEQKLKGK